MMIDASIAFFNSLNSNAGQRWLNAQGALYQVQIAQRKRLCDSGPISAKMPI